MSKSLLIVCIIALLVCATMGESVIEKLKAKVVAGTAAAPCDKAAAAPAAPAEPKPFLDIRLPVVVDDYHAPVGGFNPSHIPDKEVDVAARKILREIQAHEAEQKANGDEPEKADENLTLTTEEHVALKQLLLDADILIRAANKLNGENGAVSAGKAAGAAVAAAASIAKAAAAAAPAAAAPAAAPAADAAAAPQVGAPPPKPSTASKAAAAAPRAIPSVKAPPPKPAAASKAADPRAAAATGPK